MITQIIVNEERGRFLHFAWYEYRESRSIKLGDVKKRASGSSILTRDSWYRHPFLKSQIL